MPIQAPQLDDRSAQQIAAEAIARIPVHTPEWNNFNESDPGITLVQLFAFMTENLLYRANRAPEANRVKFLQLLGIPLQPPSPGRGLVVFENERGPIQVVPLDAGITVRAGNVPFRTRNNIDVLPVSAQIFYKRPHSPSEIETQRYIQIYGEPGTENVYYRTTPLDIPEIGKALPEVNLSSEADTIDRSLWMALLAPRNVPVERVIGAISQQTLSIGIYPSSRVNGKTLLPRAAEARQVPEPGLVFEIAAPELRRDDKLAPPNYARLKVDYAEDVLNQPGIVRVILPGAEAIRRWNFDPNEEGTGDYPPLVENEELAARIVTWIRIRLPKSEDESAANQRSQTARIVWIGVNAVRVVQAVPVENERLGVGNNAPNQVYKVTNTPVITDREVDPESGFRLEIANDSNDGWVTWTRIDDLYAAQPDDTVYTLDPESGVVCFGDGLRNGKRPPLNRIIRASYEYGGGLQGKVAIDAINKSTLPGGFKVRNPLPTWGADSGETPQQGERRIPSYLRHRDRLVTIEDFQALTRQTPGVEVGRVEILPLFNPDTYKPGSEPVEQPGALTVLVIPNYSGESSDPPIPDRLFLNAVCAWLDPRRLVTTEIFVRGPRYICLWASIGVVTMPGQMRTRVYNRVETAIRDYLSPLIGGLPPAGSDVGSGWPLGMEIRSQDLEAIAVRVEGVRYVDEVKLGVVAADNASLQQVDTVRIAGIELPWLVNIKADGTVPALSDFLARSDPNSQNRRGVPTTSGKC